MIHAWEFKPKPLVALPEMSIPAGYVLKSKTSKGVTWHRLFRNERFVGKYFTKIDAVHAAWLFSKMEKTK